MKVTRFDTERKDAHLELSRRNLLTLLAKLDHNRVVDTYDELIAMGEEQAAIDLAERPLQPRSAATIGSPLLNVDGPNPGTIWVTAVEDEEHYADRDPGPMLDNASGRLF